MKRFIKFVNEMWIDRYGYTNWKLSHEKFPVALYLPRYDANHTIHISEIFLNYGVNVKYIFSLDDEIPNLPKGIQTLPLPPKPMTDLKFVMMYHDIPELMMARKFLDAGMEVFILDPSGNRLPAYDAIMDHIDEIFEVYNSFIDDESRESYLGAMLAITTGKIKYCRFSNLDHYLLHGFLPKSGDIVIDGGACDGATASMFSDFGCKVIAFEMDRKNFEITSEVAKEKNFIVENFGLGDSNRDVFYEHSESGGSKINSGTLRTRLITLDSYVREKNLPSVDFIKLDIEGSELAMLKGAADSIVRFKPRLAISAYHKTEDLWKLQQFIKSIRPDYEFAFRHFETTYESEPYMFPEIVLNYCHRFDLLTRCPGFGEFVLFGR